MNFLKKILNKKNKFPQPEMINNRETTPVRVDDTPVINSLNLSKDDLIKSLDLRKDIINSICLEKDSLKHLTARVAVVLDFSGSMRNLYENGCMQTLLDRLLPLAMQFDDNGTLDLWLFHNEAIRLDGIESENFYDYIRQSGIMKKYPMKCTEYAPVMQDVVKRYIHEEPSDYPNLIIFITDGENSDRMMAEKIIKQSSKYPIFWQFVGIGNRHFNFLRRLDNIGDRIVDNANFFAVNNLMKMSDEELYDKLLAEYPDWIKKAKSANILK